jgi:hypothetical protein
MLASSRPKRTFQRRLEILLSSRSDVLGGVLLNVAGQRRRYQRPLLFECGRYLFSSIQRSRRHTSNSSKPESMATTSMWFTYMSVAKVPHGNLKDQFETVPVDLAKSHGLLLARPD